MWKCPVPVSSYGSVESRGWAFTRGETTAVHIVTLGSSLLRPSSASRALCALILLTALATSASALGAPAPHRSRPPVTTLGALVQLRGPSGCLIDRSKRAAGCTRVRALRGPAPFLGSDAVAISPDGRNVYVASSKSNAIAVFRRNASTGVLTQRAGAAGCIAANGASGCAQARGLDGPNSVAVSADGKNVYATSLVSNAVASFRRNPATGALTQAGEGSGCVTNAPTSGCATGRALDGPDVVIVSPDGKNVYVGAFKGNAVAVFARDTSTGALTQPTGTTGCIVDTPTSGCATALALAAPEGMAISGDGDNVYVATALSSALDVLTRDSSTGALTQASNGSGCIVESRALRLHCRHAAWRRGRGRGQPQRRPGLRDLGSEQQRDDVHSHADDGAARAADRDLGLRALRAGRRLLARPSAQRSGGPRGLA